MKGINFSLKELFFGMDTIKLGGESRNVDTKPKLYYAMDLDEPETDKKIDKGKGIDRGPDPYYEGNMDWDRGASAGGDPRPLDKGKGKEVADTSQSPFTA